MSNNTTNSSGRLTMLQIIKIRPFIKQFIETFTFSRQTLTFLAIYRIYDPLFIKSHISSNLSKIRPFSYLTLFCRQFNNHLSKALVAWVPLKGFWHRERPTRMCGLDLWLKPFKGGYSNNRRVVIIILLFSQWYFKIFLDYTHIHTRIEKDNCLSL